MTVNDLTQRKPAEDAFVSFDNDILILVDEQDREIGTCEKSTCHQNQGLLHRAFSLFIFNSQGELLLQQRSAEKRLWPLYWSNSCCSHPRSGENMEDAIYRRLHEELGLHCDLHYLYKFKYHAQYDSTGAEHEVCSVFAGCTNDPVRINRHEIAQWRYIAISALHQELQQHPQQFTPWFKLEWQALSQNYLLQLQQYCGINPQE